MCVRRRCHNFKAGVGRGTRALADALEVWPADHIQGYGAAQQPGEREVTGETNARGLSNLGGR